MEIFLPAVDSNRDTIDFRLGVKRNRKAVKRFFKKALSSNHNQIPRVITVDKNPAYPPDINKLKNDKYYLKTWTLDKSSTRIHYRAKYIYKTSC